MRRRITFHNIFLLENSCSLWSSIFLVLISTSLGNLSASFLWGRKSNVPTALCPPLKVNLSTGDRLDYWLGRRPAGLSKTLNTAGCDPKETGLSENQKTWRDFSATLRDGLPEWQPTVDLLRHYGVHSPASYLQDTWSSKTVS